MNIDLRATAQRMRRQALRRAWTTTQQRWTTSFVIGGLVLATLVTPSFGIAVFGTAFAGWWVAVALLAVFSGLVGNRIGIGREKAAMERKGAESGVR